MAVRKVTIKDVAREAGVSISTVSNALNNVNVLHPETKRHVLEVAERMHYIPNLNGKNLKSQATNVIGLFITSMRGPYYGGLSDSIYRCCKKNGYELEIFVGENPEFMVANILGHRVDGAIILNENIGMDKVRLFEEKEIPVVFIDREYRNEHMSSIIFDSYHEGELAAKYLMELGNRSFLYIQGVLHTFDNIERRRGFTNMLKKHGVILREENMLKGNFEQDTAYNAMKEYLKSGRDLPDAIFAGNDSSALGTIEALTDFGVKVPEQVSVIGGDDLEVAALVSPSITTIRTSFERQGTLAVEQVLKLMAGEPGSIEVLYGKIIPRESTCSRILI